MGKDTIIKLLERQLEAQTRTIESLEETIRDLRRTVENLESMLKERDASLSKVESQVRGLKATYLPKKSERQAAATPADPDERQRQEEERAAARKARGNNGAKRKDHFDMETRVHDLYPDVADMASCRAIGIREVIRYEMIRPSFIKHVYRIHTLKCGESVLSAKVPQAPLLNSRYDGSFMAGMAELRYIYSMPVERIVKYFRDNGFDIDKQTAHGLLAKTAGLLEKLYAAMRTAVMESGYLNCDETYHVVLVKDGSRRGYIWAMVSSETGLVYFFYDNGSRSESVIMDALKGYSGVIQSDGLRAYKNVAAKSGGRITRAACLQHCKRAFLDDSVKDIPEAREISRLANELYRNEHMHRVGEDGWTVEDNRSWRQEYAPPILAELKSRLESVAGDLLRYPPSSQMHKAATYFLNEWDGIEVIPRYGDVAWDNNSLERLNRYISLSRHNSLFFGSHAGAERGCIFYSLACSCRNNGINFFEYLTDVLNKSAAMQPGASASEYRDLLPDRWIKQ